MGSAWKRRGFLLWWAMQSIALSVATLVLFIFTVLGASLVIVWVGIPILLVSMKFTRGVANHQRRYVGGFRGEPIGVPYLAEPEGGLLTRVTAMVLDPATRRDVIWLFVDGTVGLTLSIVALVEAILDVLFWWLPPGIAARVHAHIDHPLLDVSEKSRLALRVQQLTSSRAETVDTSAAELRRIERDLHDGAQARLVALGMNLAMAEDQLAGDPDAARALLAEAREASSAALVELRDLVRGIHPPVLADRGLAGAVQALALTAPFAVKVECTLDGRLPAPVESAAYFALAEALTNIVKHAQARNASITVHAVGDELRLEVIDDGIGGADPGNGTGLRGIERRLSAFDGTLTLESPSGGPTRLVMVLPCASSSPKISPSSGTA
jgi:signal transduction histidine kinase